MYNAVRLCLNTPDDEMMSTILEVVFYDKL